MTQLLVTTQSATSEPTVTKPTISEPTSYNPAYSDPTTADPKNHRTDSQNQQSVNHSPPLMIPCGTRASFVDFFMTERLRLGMM